MNKVFTALISIFFVCCMATSHSFANGVLLDSMGPVSSGRGGANIAYSDNGTLIHDNPSALAVLKGKYFEGGTDFLTLPMNYQDHHNNQDGEQAFFSLPSFSYIQSYSQRPFGMGLGVYNPAGFATKYYLVESIYGYQKNASNSSLTKILFSLGWKITDQWSFGMGIGPAYSKMELEKPYTFQTGPFPQKTHALIDMEGDDWALAWNMGMQWQISSTTTLGLAYVDQDQFNLRGDLHLKNPVLNSDVDPEPLPVEADYKAEYAFQWPRTLGVGVTNRFQTNHMISMDVLWIGWSSAFDELAFKLSGGNNNNLPDSMEDTYPLHWKDSYAFRLGYEYSLSRVNTLRLGYIYNQNPVPNSTLTPLIPGILTNLVSFGYGHIWKNWNLNLAYQYAFGPRQAGDYNNSSVKISGHLFTMGVQYQF